MVAALTFTAGTGAQNTSVPTNVTITPPNNSLLCVIAAYDANSGPYGTFSCAATGLTFTASKVKNDLGCFTLFTCPIFTGGSLVSINVTHSSGAVRKDVLPFYVTQDDGGIPVIGATYDEDVNDHGGTQFSTIAMNATVLGSRTLGFFYTVSTTPSAPTTGFGSTVLRSASYTNGGSEGMMTAVSNHAASPATESQTFSVTGNMWTAILMEFAPGTPAAANKFNAGFFDVL